MRHLLTSLLFVLLSLNLRAQNSQTDQAEQKYAVDQNSTYNQLLQAMGRAYSDLKANPADASAAIAMNQIYNYLDSTKKIQFNFDFFLQQPDLVSKQSGLNGINKYLEEGAVVDSALSKKIADKICADLRKVTVKSHLSTAFARTGVRTLLYLHDQRGLDAILTDQGYIRRLQVIDGWSTESNSETFERLRSKYTSLGSQVASAKETAALYDLCRERRVAGVQRIEPNASVIDLRHR